MRQNKKQHTALTILLLCMFAASAYITIESTKAIARLNEMTQTIENQSLALAVMNDKLNKLTPLLRKHND